MNYAVLLGLSLFFGFAFEEFFGGERTPVPGGIRTFPLISLAGAALYLIEPHFALAFIAGLFVLGAWVFLYIRAVLDGVREPADGPLIVPTCVLIAYVLGPIALTQQLWIAFALIVGTVLLMGSREWLHALVARVPKQEAVTLGQFLLLVGVVLPLLYGASPIPYTGITPFNVWLAVVAVSALSYVSYLLQRYVLPSSGELVTAALGGATIGIAISAIAIVIAASSNNLLKAVYTVAFARRRAAVVPASALGALCALGLVVAWIMAR